MPTFQETLRFARMNITDKTSGKRLREILGILKAHDARHGLTPEKAVAILQDLGPTFVKLGQIASTHPDVLPKEYCDAFSRLRAHVAPLDFSVVNQTVVSELGKPLDELFQDFSEEPLGSASIAQVHSAHLPDGTHVAVKVRRPGIDTQMAEDLTLMRHLLMTYDFFDSDDGQITFEMLVNELERTSIEELDFTTEANNLRRFALNNDARQHVLSPHCYDDYTTTSVLTMDFADGPRVGDKDELANLSQQQKDELANLIAHNYVDQIVADGFFHADPHAGNVIITENGAGIEWIDFGMMGELSSYERGVVRDMINAVARQNAYELKRCLLKVATPNAPINHGQLLDMCESVIDQYANADLDSFNTGSLLQDLMSQMRAGGYEFSPFIMMLGRGLVTLEGTIHMLSGSISVSSVVSGYVQSNFDFKRIEKEAMKAAFQSADSVRASVAMPQRMSEALDMLEKGQLHMGMNATVDKTTRADFTNSVDHFTLAIIAAALFMGSCVLCLTGLQPQVLGVPLLGLIGFACGLFIAIYVFIEMHKERRRRKNRKQ